MLEDHILHCPVWTSVVDITSCPGGVIKFLVEFTLLLCDFFFLRFLGIFQYVQSKSDHFHFQQKRAQFCNQCSFKVDLHEPAKGFYAAFITHVRPGDLPSLNYLGSSHSWSATCDHFQLNLASTWNLWNAIWCFSYRRKQSASEIIVILKCFQSLFCNITISQTFTIKYFLPGMQMKRLWWVLVGGYFLSLEWQLVCERTLLSGASCSISVGWVLRVHVESSQRVTLWIYEWDAYQSQLFWMIQISATLCCKCNMHAVKVTTSNQQIVYSW